MVELSVAAFLAAHWRSAYLCLLDSSLRALGGAVGEYRANLFAEPRLERGSECGAPAPVAAATPRTKARDQSARWATYTFAAVAIASEKHTQS